jgi:hypothetical protein
MAILLAKTLITLGAFLQGGIPLRAADGQRWYVPS